MITPISNDGGNHQEWLPFVDDFRIFLASEEAEKVYKELAMVT